LSRYIEVFERVCQTVAYAHSRCVIHRDLKPSNVMVGSFGEVQVMDWGIAKVLTSEREEGGEGSAARLPGNEDPLDSSQPGQIMGTLPYMSPEQARSEEVDARADVFSLGSMLCATLTGLPAYAGMDYSALRNAVQTGKVSDAYARLSD